MKISFDTEAKTLAVEDGDTRSTVNLYSPEAFAQLSRIWVKVGWALRYSYGFTWMGRPIIQMPEDMVRIQETLYRVKPDVVIETGVAHGGSLIFYASLFKAMGKGRVVGVDIDIRPHNRSAIEAHELASSITLIQGSSIADETLAQVRAQIRPGERVLVILDSNHSAAHVAAELARYSPLVSVGSYLVATDGIMQDLHDVPGGQPGWGDDNPAFAARQFCASNPGWELETPPFLMTEAKSQQQVTHWPDAYLKRVR